MTERRINLGFSDELNDFNPTDWTSKPMARALEKASSEATAEAAEKSGFISREPIPTKPKKFRRGRKTGRNAQINIKAKPETIEAFYELADRQNWGLGETLEHALDLLQKKYAQNKPR